MNGFIVKLSNVINTRATTTRNIETLHLIAPAITSIPIGKSDVVRQRLRSSDK